MMNKYIKAVSLTLMAVAGSQLLVACQSTPTTTTVQHYTPLRISNIPTHDNESSIACEGTLYCSIMRIDDTQIEELPAYKEMGRPTVAEVQALEEEPLPDSGVKIIPLILPEQSILKTAKYYYARTAPKKHEVHVNFYPEANESYIERFAIIHDFSKTGAYRLSAYREPVEQESISLFETASPEPLCVDVWYNDTLIRKLCKLSKDGKQDEFVEVDLKDPKEKKIKEEKEQLRRGSADKDQEKEATKAESKETQAKDKKSQDSQSKDAQPKETQPKETQTKETQSKEAQPKAEKKDEAKATTATK